MLVGIHAGLESITLMPDSQRTPIAFHIGVVAGELMVKPTRLGHAADGVVVSAYEQVVALISRPTTMGPSAVNG